MPLNQQVADVKLYYVLVNSDINRPIAPIAHDLNTSDLWHLLVSKKHKPRAISWQSYGFF